MQLEITQKWLDGIISKNGWIYNSQQINGKSSKIDGIF